MVLGTVIGMLVVAGLGASVQAQDQGGPGGGRRGNFDPAQMRARMEQMMKEQLGVSDDEWKVIQPKLEKVQQAQRDARGGGFGGMMGGRRGGRGGFGGNQPETPVAKAAQDLRQTLENKDAKSDDILAKLKAYRAARDEARENLAKAQKDLREVLTQRQEAQLVLMGTLD